MERQRCDWAGSDPLYQHYHDREWGVPLHDERGLFEFLILEGMQAGLSWITVLRKREAFREAFDNFDVERVARYQQDKLNTLLANPGIIRNKLKIESAVRNARAFIRVQDEIGSFNDYIWGFVDARPIQNDWPDMASVPAFTPLAKEISRDMKKRGFNFVGPTIVYATMQATGMVNDHLSTCFRHAELKGVALS